MNWLLHQTEIVGNLPPDVACFVLHALKRMEQENVFDAPGIISGVLHQMHRAESDAIRLAASRTGKLLHAAFVRTGFRPAGA